MLRNVRLALMAFVILAVAPAIRAAAMPARQAETPAAIAAEPLSEAGRHAIFMPAVRKARVDAIYWGASMGGVPWNMARLTAWESTVANGKGVSVVHWWHDWGNGDGSAHAFEAKVLDAVRMHGSIPMITWNPRGGPDPARWRLAAIINGTHDAYIRQYATAVKNWGYPIFIRLMHEMNGDWNYEWQELQNGNRRGEYVPAYRHVVDIFRAVGANNVSFVWCPNIVEPTSDWPSLASLYPGDGYVDWTALDGYNWGATQRWGWWSFDRLFNYSYNVILKLAPSKPVMIAEFGTVEVGGDKAAWIADALGTQLPGRYPRVRAAIYANYDGDGAMDWYIETSQASINAWKAQITGSYYLRNGYGSTTGKPPVP
jgi:hypothetical protein